jgi:hyperosmotically inducible periplasmic protein
MPHKSARRINSMRLVCPTPIRTALFAGLLLGGLAVAGAQQPSDQSAPPESAPQTDQQAPQTAPPTEPQTTPQADQQPAAQQSAPEANQQAAPQADQQPAAQTASPADHPPADNTKMNERDRNPNEPTADRQKDNRSDREITQQVRKAIVKDKSLSTYAHNVKVITQNGMVTLKGPVRSEEEKKAIEAKAAEVAGQDKVTNQLDVKSKD